MVGDPFYVLTFFMITANFRIVQNRLSEDPYYCFILNPVAASPPVHFYSGLPPLCKSGLINYCNFQILLHNFDVRKTNGL